MIDKEKFAQKAKKWIIDGIADNITDQYYEHVDMLLEEFFGDEKVSDKQAEELGDLHCEIAYALVDEIREKILK